MWDTPVFVTGVRLTGGGAMLDSRALSKETARDILPDMPDGRSVTVPRPQPPPSEPTREGGGARPLPARFIAGSNPPAQIRPARSAWRRASRDRPAGPARGEPHQEGVTP